MLSNLAAEMTRKQMTQKQMAQKMGIHYVTLGQKIRGKVDFTVREALKILDILDIMDADFKYLFQKEA